MSFRALWIGAACVCLAVLVPTGCTGGDSGTDSKSTDTSGVLTAAEFFDGFQLALWTKYDECIPGLYESECPSASCMS